MKDISDELKEKLKSGSVKFNVIISLYKENECTDITNEQFTGFNYSVSSSGEQFEIGCFQSAQLSFSIPVSEENAAYWNKYRFTDVLYVTLNIKCVLNRTGACEEFSLGKFYINKTKRENDIITVDCFDAAINFDVVLYEGYFDKVKEVKEAGYDSIPIADNIILLLKESSLSTYIDDVTKEQMNEFTLIKGTHNGENADYYAEIACDDLMEFRGKTAREMLMMFCEFYSGFCYIGVEGFLRFKNYNKDDYADELMEDEMFSFNYDGTVKITGLRLTAEFKNKVTFPSGDVTVKTIKDEEGKVRTEILHGTEGAVIEISDNIFVGSKYNLDVAIALQKNVFAFLDMKFTPCSLSAVVNPAYEVGDLIKVTDHWGKEHNVYITSISLKDNIEMEISNAGNDEFDFIEEMETIRTWQKAPDTPNYYSCNNRNTTVIDDKIYVNYKEGYSYNDSEDEEAWKTDSIIVPNDFILHYLFSYDMGIYAVLKKSELEFYLFKYENGIKNEPMQLFQLISINNDDAPVICGKYLYILKHTNSTSESTYDVIKIYLGTDETIEKCTTQSVSYAISSNNAVSYEGKVYAIIEEEAYKYEIHGDIQTVYDAYICKLSDDLKSYEKLYVLPHQSESGMADYSDGQDGILAVYKDRLHILGKSTIYSFGIEDKNYHYVYDLKTGGFNSYSDAPYMCYGGAFIEYKGKLHLLSGDYNNYHYVYTEE